MAALRCFRYKSLIKPLFGTRTLIMDKDYKPGQYPKTPEEHAASAKSYNMIPEDYKPISQDYWCLGDYPDIPIISGASRDPYYPYDYPALKRNYGEVSHFMWNYFTEDRFDYNYRYRYSGPVMIASNLGLIGFIAGVILLGEYFNIKQDRPYLPQHFPNDGRVHYSFELVDEDAY